MSSVVSQTYGGLAQILTDNGFPVVPVVQGNKKPAIKRAWQNFVYSEASAREYSDSSIGIITGQARDGCQPIVGVDIDVTDERIAGEFRDDVMRKYGETIWRVGMAPKSLLVYRAAAPGIPKQVTRKYSCGRVEILGNGQQFVAYGIHKDTRRPYTWPGLLGSPIETTSLDVPTLSAQDISDILVMYERVMSAAGHAPLSMSTASGAGCFDDLEALMSPPIGLTIEESWGYMKSLNVDDRDTWLHVGMALHHEFRASVGALGLWDEWSMLSPKYQPGECERLWGGFGKSDRNELTARWLVKAATETKTEADKQRISLAEQCLMNDIPAAQTYTALLQDLAPRIAAEGFSATSQAILKNKLKERFKEITGTPLPAGVLQDALRDGTVVPEGHGLPLTEMGNAERMVKKYGKDIMYNPELDRWYRWDGSRWCPCVKELVLRMADRVVRSIKDEAARCHDEEDKEKLSKWYMASQKAVMLDNMLKLSQKEKGIMVSAQQMDANTDYLGVSNGAVYLPTGELIEPEREHRITLNCGVAYDPDARAPLFYQTVLDAFYDDEEIAGFLQRLVGYAILGRPEKEEIVVIPEGKGANGKSTIFNAIAHTLGAYAKFAGASSFTGSVSGSASGAREDVLRLLGARFVYVTELEENGVLKESFIKGMTGGEAMPARGLYSRHTVEVYPSWVAFMPTNHLPIVKGEDKGIWRKIVVIPFHRDFTADADIKKDVNRKAKLKAEAQGILRWAVEGAMSYLQGGLRVPEKICQASEAYRDEMDLLSDWLMQCCRTAPDAAANNCDLWASWKYFADREGMLHLIPSSAALSRRLAGRGFERIRGSHGRNGRGFRGISVVDEDA